MSPEREPNPLVARVDALLRRHQEAAQRIEEDVPVLTELAEPDAGPAPGAAQGDDPLAGDLERALIARLAPELDRRLAGLRADLERELRRAVREAVGHALAARRARPGEG
jgi:hypothetical protein